MFKLNVGVMRGGISGEYEASLKTGAIILNNLDREKYRPVDLLITKEGILHADGLPIQAKSLRGLVDVVWNALHGGPGEDGTIQKILSDLNVPQTGSGSEFVLNKQLAKEKLRNFKIRTPYGLAFELEENNDFEEDVKKKAGETFNRISPPWIVKPLVGGTSIDAFIARDFSELFLAMKEVFRKHKNILVEECVKGREVVGGLIDNFRGREHYDLLPLEIKENRFAHARDLSSSDKDLLKDILIKAKKELDLRQYFTANFILTPRGAYLLEIDSLPHLHDEAVLSKSLGELGIGMPEFIDHCISLAVK